MNVYLRIVFIVLLFSSAYPSLTDRWQLYPTVNSIHNVFKHVINTGYQRAIQIKNEARNFIEDNEKTVIDDINNFVENFKGNGRIIAEPWSFVQTDEIGARMENPEMKLSVPARITRYHYRCETHTIMSQGYILNVHRIPHSKISLEVPRKTVILQHGLFGSSADWILNGPDKSLAYVLADAGYDVWMPNIRGNKYSKEHAAFKSNSKSFWNFSWHDVALYDLPAIIDYIITLKGEDTKITYMGHSMGTTILFAMLSLRPEYNNKLSAGFALAPVAFFSDLKSPVKLIIPFISNVAKIEMLTGRHEFIPKNSILGRLTNICDIDAVETLVCKNVIFHVCGFNEKQLNQTVLPAFLSNLGTGTSWKTAVHFAQLALARERFQQFDYGKDNLRIYGVEQPPEYDLSKITLPIKLFWADNDLLSSEKDVRLLYGKLSTTKQIYRVQDPDFNHVDYLWAIDAPTLLNKEILDSLDKV